MDMKVNVRMEASSRRLSSKAQMVVSVAYDSRPFDILTRIIMTKGRTVSRENVDSQFVDWAPVNRGVMYKPGDGVNLILMQRIAYPE